MAVHLCFLCLSVPPLLKAVVATIEAERQQCIEVFGIVTILPSVGLVMRKELRSFPHLHYSPFDCPGMYDVHARVGCDCSREEEKKEVDNRCGSLGPSTKSLAQCSAVRNAILLVAMAAAGGRLGE